MRSKKLTDTLLQSFGKIKDDDFEFGFIDQYFRSCNHDNSHQVISDNICNDLDIHALFKLIDRTTSRVGQQVLYNMIRSIPNKSKIWDNDELLIRTFTDDEELRIRSQQQLYKLNSIDAYHISSLFLETHIEKLKWFLAIPLLSFTSILSLFLIFFNPKLIFVFTVVFLLNLGIHYLNKKNLYKYLGSIPELLRLSNVAKQLYKNQQIQTVAPNLSQTFKSFKQIRNRLAFFRFEARIQNDIQAIVWGVLELVKIVFLIEPLFLFSALKQIDNKRDEIEQIFCFVGHIDCLISISSLRHGLPVYCKPTITQSPIHFQEIFHPLIDNCVENSISLNNKSILLTGSNMSGKTSFIRAVGINVISALTLNTCFAKVATLPHLKIHSAIRMSDDLLNDKSYYFEEVLTIQKMITACEETGANLFLLDEIFKGTNTIERISAGKAVLSKLSSKNNSVFVSTHDVELADLLEETYDLYHFSEHIENQSIDFDYKLKSGKLQNRNAIRILQLNNYPEDIISEALHLSKILDQKASQNV